MSLLLLCLIVLLVLGGAERLARDRAWRDVPIRIHVNGTRAKSSVTRLIWAALLEAGVPTAAKTTGTAPRVLWPDGREEPLTRRSPANVREQLEFLRAARRRGARAVVVECMALDPSLQRVTERDMVSATIGVITNVRFDHAEVMGADLDTIAGTLANTIPVGGVLVIGARAQAPIFIRGADALGTRVVVAAEAPEDPVAENEAVAIAVTRELGIDDAVARRGFARAPHDPGTVKRGTVGLPGGTAAWIDATAANDPESLSLLLRGDAGWAGHAKRVLVYNHRDDRVPRLAGFAEQCEAFVAADRLLITGTLPPWTVRRRLGRLPRRHPVAFVPPAAMAEWIRSNAAGAALAFAGNTRGIEVLRLIEEAAADD